ncbi:rhomboid family intramembrane serine protease [Dysgonomonas sp. 511]|uniref:rhomboid family intramembrane serine protease n=1 Tax=Dysgonomonas sp. 511 TaxID=2302930 RepID=UPI0013D5B0F9|nr:rhomboid family intramembrane serine protease [Dysgonomonas sp. 511]
MKEFFGKLRASIELTIIIVLVIWIVAIVEHLFHLDFFFLGIYPRESDGLIGILFSPFVHGNWEHLIANTLPLFILLVALFFFYGRKSGYILPLLWITSGITLWLVGRPAWHIGASSVIYALASFLVFGGIISRNIKLVIVAVVVAVLYCGLIYGMFPGEEGISWEGHLSGFLSGILWAFLLKNRLREIKKQAKKEQ